MKKMRLEDLDNDVVMNMCIKLANIPFNKEQGMTTMGAYIILARFEVPFWENGDSAPLPFDEE